MGLACLEVGDPAVQETQRGTNATYVDEVGEEGAVGAGQQRRHPHGSFFCGVISMELCCFADGEVRRSVCASFHVRRNVPDPVGRRRLLVGGDAATATNSANAIESTEPSRGRPLHKLSKCAYLPSHPSCKPSPSALLACSSYNRHRTPRHAPTSSLRQVHRPTDRPCWPTTPTTANCLASSFTIRPITITMVKPSLPVRFMPGRQESILARFLMSPTLTM